MKNATPRKLTEGATCASCLRPATTSVERPALTPFGIVVVSFALCGKCGSKVRKAAK